MNILKKDDTMFIYFTKSIMTTQQLKAYAYALPWYKRIFFSSVIWNYLQQESVTEAGVRALYTSKIQGSWLEPFYNWLFPALSLFIQIPANYESDLRKSIFNKDDWEFNRLLGFLSTHRIEEDTLIRILRNSIRCDYYYAKRIRSHKTVYNANVVSKAFVEAAKNTNNEWLGIDAISAFTYEFSPLRSLINSASINEVLLLLAQNYQALISSQKQHGSFKFVYVEQQLKQMLENKEICNKISRATTLQFFQHILVPFRYDSDTSVALIGYLVSCEDMLHESDIQLAYLQIIRVGRVKALAAFHEDILQPWDERVIQALQDAAKNAHYTMVLHLINKIPSARRFVILQTKAIVQNDKQYQDTREPKFTHILQWAACRSVTGDIHVILNALDNIEERCALITKTPNEDDYSPLLLAAINCRQKNLSIMLSILSDEQAIEAILPHKVTFFTPLNPSDSYPVNNHEIKVMPILLDKLFGENQKLYTAYQYLKTHLGWDTLRALRDHYLATHFPTKRQTAIRFFTGSYSIPGHPLNKEELDKVVRVVFYQNYHEFDTVERSRIESRMNSREKPLENVAAI